MNISIHNQEIFKKFFNWMEIGRIDKETISLLANKMGIHVVNPDEIKYRAPWMDYKNITVLTISGKKIFYMKKLWESGTFKEIIGMELGKIFDPELCINHYVAGTFLKKIGKRKVPFLIVPWVEGKPISKEQSMDIPFLMGRMYEFGRWLCLYDCYPRHYYFQPGISIKRIDYGQSFFKLNKEYEGFADIWPKELISDPRFMEGIKDEHDKIRTRFKTVEHEVFKLINCIKSLKLDDFFHFRGPRLYQNILDYWRNEGYLDENYQLQHSLKFLHIPIKNRKN